MKRLLAAGALAGLTACAAATTNYPDPAGPRFAGGVASSQDPLAQFRVVSFNIAMGRHVDRVIALLRVTPELRAAQIILLQEADSDAVRTIADSLGFAWVYYPATLHPRSHKDHGNAVLSRLPISQDEKLPLPHLARGRRTAKAAVAVTVLVGGTRVRVYSVHLATMLHNGPTARRDQLRTVLADADSYPVVVLGGDFNSESVPEIARERGYTWPTHDLPRTHAFWTFDHILLKGLPDFQAESAGVVHDTRRASDHRPIWLALTQDQLSAPLPANTR